MAKATWYSTANSNVGKLGIMKVVHITSGHDWYDARIFERQCMSLANTGNEVHLVGSFIESGRKNGILLHPASSWPRGRWQRLVTASRDVMVRAAELKGHIYHFHDPSLLPWTHKLKEKNPRAKIIYDVHEDYPTQTLYREYIPKKLRGFASHTVGALEDRWIKNVDGIIAATPTIEQKFLKKNCRAVSVCNYPRFDFAQSSRISYSERTIPLVYVGGIEAHRGAREMVEVAQSLQQRLVLAGGISSTFRLELEGLRGWSNVEYRGQISRENVWSLLSESKIGLCLLHPLVNYLDALPVKLFEYMASGIPVICSNFPLWQKIVDSAKCGICVDVNDVWQIESAVRKLIDNPGFAEEMGLRGREAVEKQFSWKSQETKLLTFYEELIRGRV